MMIPSTHASLLRDLRSDDRREEAWAAFQVRYGEVILVWCRRRGLWNAAEDLTQEVLLRLFQRLSAYDPAKGRFRSWLKAVVNNILTDWRRRQRPDHGGVGGTAYLDALDGLESPEAADELSDVIEGRDAAVRDELYARVQARVEAKTWQAYYQTVVEQRPAAEVAAELGLAAGAVHKYKSRVIQMLNQEFIHVRPAD
jgi:RNA polymerase sigma factor (sigma-70 family)